MYASRVGAYEDALSDERVLPLRSGCRLGVGVGSAADHSGECASFSKGNVVNGHGFVLFGSWFVFVDRGSVMLSVP